MKWITISTPEAIEAHRQALAEIAIELTIQTANVVTSQVTDWHMDELIFQEGIIHAERTNHQGDRWHFSPARPKNTPTGYGGGPDYTKISVSATRPPEAIARDILRRCYSDALNYWQEWQRITERHAREVEQFNAIVDRLETAGMRKPYHRNHYDDEATHGTMHDNNVTADVYASGIYSFKITSLTVDQAVKILEILKESE